MSEKKLNSLIENPPLLHRHGDGKKVSWGVSESVLRFIADHSKPGWRTIETGAGLSTVAFVLPGAEHYSVFPEAYLEDTILEYLNHHGISSENLNFIIGESQNVLPNININGFDMALIDGEHAFPIPFLDWYYIARKLKPGGILIIDDTQIWTGHVLRNFLLLEPEWRLLWEFYGTVIFRLETAWVEKWWAKQAYTVFHSQITPETVPHLPDQARRSIVPIYDMEG